MKKMSRGSRFFKSKKMSNQLLLNYILFLILFLGMIFITIIGVLMYFAIKYDVPDTPEAEKISAYQIIKKDYRNIDASYVLKNNGYIEVLDNDLKVIMEKGSKHKVGFKYTVPQFYDIIFNKNEDASKYSFESRYSDNKDFILIVAMPNEYFLSASFDKNKNDIYIEYPDENGVSNEYSKESKKERLKLRIFLVILFLFFIASMVLYSKLTSRTFVKPLKELLKGVNRVKNGDYAARVEIDSINEIGQLKDAFNLMAAKIQEETLLKEKAEENRKKMILDISHDLKNPLTSILGYSEYLLKNKEISQEEIEKLLKVINNNSSRANDLIQDLFEFSRVESHGYKLDIVSEDIGEFIRELIAVYIPMMEDKGINYDFEISEDSIRVPFDRKKLDRALSNLIVNAVKYNAEGTNVKVSMEEKESSILIVIEDDGIGIPEELVENIFKPFFRVDSARNSKTGGTGLGLAITKTIIEKHGGTIELKQNAQKGCSFVVALKKE